MPKATGHIKFAIVERSKRLQKVVSLLKAAKHPLSGMEITLQSFYPNASTNIGEIRNNDGINPGTNRYIVSAATAWKGGKYSWHDGVARYWLIGAPGWVPRWTVSKEGEIVPYTKHQGNLGTGQGLEKNALGEACERTSNPLAACPAAHDPIRTCRLQTCGAPIPPDRKDTAEFCCDEHKDEFWKNIREAGKMLLQGKLAV